AVVTETYLDEREVLVSEEERRDSQPVGSVVHRLAARPEDSELAVGWGYPWVAHMHPSRSRSGAAAPPLRRARGSAPSSWLAASGGRHRLAGAFPGAVRLRRRAAARDGRAITAGRAAAAPCGRAGKGRRSPLS